MVRPFSGQEYIEAAREQREQARSVDELRQALAVLLPLELGVNLEQVALVLGRSKGAHLHDAHALYGSTQGSGQCTAQQTPTAHPSQSHLATRSTTA